MYNSTHSCRVALSLLLYYLLCNSAYAQSDTAIQINQNKLTAELKATLDDEGAEAAKQRFEAIYPVQKGEYPYDPQAFTALITSYANSGDMEALDVLVEINSTLSQDMMQQQLAAAQPELLALMEAQQQAETKAKQELSNQQPNKPNKMASEPNGQIRLRTDLNRFTGLYGAQTPHRQLWVSKTCEGQLVIGATWGDAAPWWMRPSGDTVFTYQDDYFSLTITFKMDDENQAIAMKHDLGISENPLQRTGPLTADFQACMNSH